MDATCERAQTKLPISCKFPNIPKGFGLVEGLQECSNIVYTNRKSGLVITVWNVLLIS